MRIIAVVLALVATQASADQVFSGEGLEIRLHNQKCTHPKVVALLKPEWIKRFKQGTVIFHGQHFQMCWLDRGDGNITILDEDSDTATVPASAFKKVSAI